ncbi:hypothetical protein HYDPIDRAFT_99483 [Hydnomerulius pinastri MD-312]|uniref:T6SS Phospholipase effector Tle1-like catalytic domain-containing protein n=1 Tax=Hydnomerulius pinastri MD-312 TaxID=994086 RepID=A0A0C9V3T0_9AGAM|nr:hypothetical protein HYDPIDRAFT_99483 [Hydnomerulius pinastri MD-312]
MASEQLHESGIYLHWLRVPSSADSLSEISLIPRKLSTPAPEPATPTCIHHKDSRNIIVCIDGTSNKFGEDNTNIVKLYADILKGDEHGQHAYYSSGIGTSPDKKSFTGIQRKISDSLDMAIAWNLEEIVKDAYAWLANEYKKGDRIFLFGFSRGAYQVRVLAGMIHEVGLITSRTEKQIATAYEHYTALRKKKPQSFEIAREFKRTFSHKDLRLHFIGVWDTVSSVGVIRGDPFPSTSASGSHACHFRHALALDEYRVKFLPEYFGEINSAQQGNDVKEVWFAGSHSDVFVPLKMSR